MLGAPSTMPGIAMRFLAALIAAFALSAATSTTALAAEPKTEEEKALYDRMLRNAVLLCDRSLEGEEDSGGDVYVDGASNILTKPDFVDIDRMRELFRTFEEKSRLIKILNECVSHDNSYAGDVHVMIGREHPSTSLRNCALITAPYRFGSNDRVGTLGVVGPMRIEYARIMAMVNYMARLIEHRLSDVNA